MRLAVLLAASLACVGIGFAKSAALSAACERSGNTAENYPVSAWRDCDGGFPAAGCVLGDGKADAGSVPGFFTGYFRGYAPPGRKDTAGDSGREYGSPPGGHTPYKRRKRRAAGGRMQPWHRGPRHAEGESDRYEAHLVQRIAELQKGLPERKRLCQSLGIMGGLFLFLILV